MKKTFLWMILFGCGLTLVQANAQGQETGSLEAQNTEAYLSMMDGDQLLEAGDDEAAEAKYREALAQYQALREQDPDFKNRVVSYRIELLEENLAALAPEDTLLSGPESMDGETDTPSGPENFQNLYLQAREQLAEETARLSVLERRMIEADARVRDIRDALRERSAELLAARQERLKVNQQLDAVQNELKDVAKFNELLKERTEEVETRNRELIQERGRLAGQVAELQDRLEPLQAELDAVTKELAETNLNSSQGEQRLILERNQLRDDKTEMQRQMNEQSALISQMRERIEDVALLEEAVIVLNNRNESQAKQLESLRETGSTPEKEIVRLTNRIEELQNQLNSQQNDMEAENQQALSELREKNMELAKQNAELQQNLGRTSVTVKNQQDLITTMRAALEASSSTTLPQAAESASSPDDSEDSEDSE